MKKTFAVLLCLMLLLGMTAALAETWTCPNCGGESEFAFCPYCGEKKPENIICPECGAVYPSSLGYTFCGNCGAPLPRGLAVGDIVNFGRYEQDNDPSNGKEEIEWIVLEVDDDRALLLSKYGLDAKPYHTKDENVTWEKCTLRAWLNDDFLNAAFTVDEQAQILLTDVDNSQSQGYSKWSTKGGNDTQDKVFLLSYAEANRYLGVTYDNSNNTRSRVSPTAYAKANGAYTSDSNWTEEGAAAGLWWLRSPGGDQLDAARVYSAGSLSSYPVLLAYDVVRPAFWINLESGIF